MVFGGQDRLLILLNLIFITLNNIPVCLIERRNGDFFLASLILKYEVVDWGKKEITVPPFN